MIIDNCNRNEDGSLDFEFHVDEEEAAFLMNHAVQNLITKGTLEVEVQKAEQEFALFKYEGGGTAS
jgi:hypothetical protein